MQRVRAQFYSDLDDDAWNSQRKQVYAWPSTANKLRVRPLGIGTTLTEDVEDELVRWAAELRKDGVPVARLLLTTKARELAHDAGLMAHQFKASHSWTTSLLKQHRLAFRARTRCVNATDADGHAAAVKFGQDVADIINTKVLHYI
ncbi:hypothetical protein ACHHYP_20410 [Achlya hypogyna]|uniref:HTH CENPB-type domain-containing protein n=1 Tax=Achlya hypogyna TaxID=1202772 RepID=A0A1V9YNF6_ACHHY|nr:hypothetical protein ACHHYP_20410 [Achlya hypogyna]